MMRVVFNTWAGAFFQKGGGEIQLLQSKEALENDGVEVILYDQWKPDKTVSLLHQFSIESGVDLVVKKYKELKIPVALSTILWNLPPVDTQLFNYIHSLLNLADILFTNSDLESERISKHFEIPLEKFHKTRNSISSAYFHQSSPDLFLSTFRINEPFVLCVANIDERKNTHVLVKACKELQVKLVTVGHVKDHSYFDTFKDSYERYIHLGPIENENMLRSAYRACSVFALPSLCETPGIAALEAASQGAKIVLTAEGSTREYFKEYITYVTPWIYESVRDGIKTELEREPSLELSKFVVENYTWEETSKELRQGYEKILGRIC